MSDDTSEGLAAEVSHDLCAGTGMCIRAAPHAFRYNREKLAIFKGPGAWTAEQLRKAEEACPMEAIRIIVSERSVT